MVMEATDQAPAPLRDASLLEGAVGRPEVAAHYAGADLFEQAAILAVANSQAQAFADGNKRTAIASCRAFLHRNGRPFRRTSPALFRTLVDAAEARDVGRRLALATLARLLREGCAGGRARGVRVADARGPAPLTPAAPGRDRAGPAAGGGGRTADLAQAAGGRTACTARARSASGTSPDWAKRMTPSPSTR